MLKKIISAALSCFTALSFCPAAFAFEGEEIKEEKQYIVKYLAPEISLFSEDVGEELFDVVSEEELSDLLAEDMIDWYEEDYDVELFGTEPLDINEPGTEDEKDSDEAIFGQGKWDLTMIGASFYYGLDLKGKNIKIGVIDSGIAAHSELNGSLIKGYNYIDSSDDTGDTVGHGTFVAGIIASAADGVGISGAAPETKIVPLKCFDNKSTKVSVIAKAIYGAVNDFGCDILNMSFGLSENSEALSQAVEYARSKGVIMTAAAGNYGTDTLYYPAAYDSVIGVGYVDKDGVASKNSQHNKSVFIVAPGVSLKSTGISGGYITGSGSSYATPLVSAAAAVLKSADSSADTDRIKELLKASCVDKGEAGYDEYYGYGILNIQNALKEMFKGYSYFIFTPEVNDGKRKITVYNNTENELSGTLISVQYNGKIMKGVNTENIKLAPGKTASVKYDVSDYSVRSFVWQDISQNTPLSNSVLEYAPEKTEDEEIKLLSLKIMAESDGELALTVYGKNGESIYYYQEKLKTGEIEIKLPLNDAIDLKEDEKLCQVIVDAEMNGKKLSLPAEEHDFDTKVIPPTGAEKGYTEYTCRKCGYSYKGDETDAIGYFVAFDANGGQNAPEKQNKRPGEPLTLTESIPERVGYSFSGWTDEAESEEIKYMPGAEYGEEADKTLYAVWKINTYKITYILDGAEYKTSEVLYGDKIKAERAPSKSGYTFLGWGNLPETMPAEDITVEGTYKKKSSGGGGGGGGSSSSVKAPSEDKKASASEEAKEEQKEEVKEEIKEEEDYDVYLFSFSDVKNDDWYSDGVSFALKNGLMKGVSETEFAPGEPITRAMFVTVIYRLCGEPEVKGGESFFDVGEDAYYKKAAEWAAGVQLVKGVSEGIFDPEGQIKREDMALISYRLALYKGKSIKEGGDMSFTDIGDISEAAKSAVRWANSEKIMTGSPDGSFNPKSGATRAETAVILKRLYELLCK